MPDLYLANPTNQTQIVSFRLDFTKDGERQPNQRFRPANQREIKAGQQVMIRDLHMKAVTHILDQLRPYGMFQVGELTSGAVKSRDMVTYIAQVGLVVPQNAILAAEMHNRRMKTLQGQKRREQAAIATNSTVQSAVQNQFLEMGIPAEPADSTEVTFEQLEQPEASDTAMVAEGFEIVPEGKIGQKSQKPARAAPRSRANRKR